MPLNRDQQAIPDISTSVASYTTNKQHQRIAGLNLADENRPATPQNEQDKRSQSQVRRDNVDSKSISQHAGKKFSLDASMGNVSAFNGFKMTVPNTMAFGKAKTSETAASGHDRTPSKQRKLPANSREETQKVSLGQTPCISTTADFFEGASKSQRLRRHCKYRSFNARG